MEQYDSVKALWLEIDKVHLSYLQTDGNAHRFEQKRKLEGFMREYLNLVPPSQRFYFSATGELLYNSILAKNKDFSASKCGLAWDAIDSYASNLLNHPWRKEFQEIRLYSGGYKHQIESQLLCAEEMLMLMGYNFEIESNRLILNTVIDPDTVALVSRDCMLAKVESQILGEIQAALVSRLGSFSFEDIIEYRKKYVGSVSHTVRGLLYQHHQKESLAYYATPAQSSFHTENFSAARQMDVNPNFYPNPQYHYHQLPYPDFYRNHGFPIFPTVINDEVDSKAKSQIDNGCFANASNSAETPSSAYSGISLARDRESKYLPKFLEQIDFDNAERLCYEDVDSKELPNDHKFSKKAVANGNAAYRTNRVLPNAGNYEHSPVNPSGANGTLTKRDRAAKKEDEHGAIANLSKTKLNNPEGHKHMMRRLSSEESSSSSGWECIACTYVNKTAKDICEMCAKSRNMGPELQPLFKGGRECSKCTLVNPREDLYCRACAASLREAPTYI